MLLRFAASKVKSMIIDEPQFAVLHNTYTRRIGGVPDDQKIG